MQYTQKQIETALKQRNIRFSKSSQESFEIDNYQYEFKPGEKVVRIFKNVEYPRFGGVYTVAIFSKPWIYTVEIKNKGDMNRFIPASWLTPKKNHLPTWL
jgi:hypothetical protein